MQKMKAIHTLNNIKERHNNRTSLKEQVPEACNNSCTKGMTMIVWKEIVAMQRETIVVGEGNKITIVRR
jgi:hypothetical protein